MEQRIIINKNEPVWIFLNPLYIAHSLIKYRELIYQLVVREITGKYKGSYLGVLWSFATPLAMLTIYTFVFSFIFKVRWGLDIKNRFQFAFILFCGLTIFQVFSECCCRASYLITANPHYVKKIVFPL
jgi:lipopolysaccharide transport system permease protein